MKKKLLALSLPAGLLIEMLYLVGNRFFIKFPDAVASSLMVVSIGLMVIGLAYYGYCLGKHKNPYDFK